MPFIYDFLILGKIKKLIKLNPISPAFFLLFFWFLISGKITIFFIFFLTLLIHELGHYIAAVALGYKLNSFYLTLTGAQLNYNSGIFDNKDEIKIGLAGPLTNIFIAIFIISLWWIVPSIYGVTYLFVFQNLVLGLFNLLPAFPLDGGRIVSSLLSQKYSKTKVLKGLKISNIILSIVFFILFFISALTNYNPMLILTVVFLLSGIIDTEKEIKYERLYFFKKRKRSILKTRILFVPFDITIDEMLKKIERSKFTIFYVEYSGKHKFLPEDVVINLSLSFPFDTKIGEILDLIK